jgi:hypothetical protein
MFDVKKKGLAKICQASILQRFWWPKFEGPGATNIASRRRRKQSARDARRSS